MVAQRASRERFDGQSGGWRPPLALEQRAGLELAELLASPVYYGLGVPRGDDRRVLLIPGFMGSDNYLTILGGWLRRIGYRPAQSGIILNAGSLGRLLAQVERRVEALAADQGGRVTIIGHSLGGVFARIAAVTRPDLVEGVIALGSPLVGNPRDAAHPVVRALGDVLIQDRPIAEADALARLAAPLPEGVHLTSIYSRDDAVVDWHSCIDRDLRATNIEVRGSHVGLAWNASVYRRLGRLLAE
jgi:triacylglycerol lipase